MAAHIEKIIKEAGAMHIASVKVEKIQYYDELLELCAMNSCGKYNTSWGCPPKCGDIDTLREKLGQFHDGIAFQYIGSLEDSFDYDNMVASGKAFEDITVKIKKRLRMLDIPALVLGAGGCSICGQCTCPDAPCRFPDLCSIPMEGLGINVSELCALAGLKYMNGVNTVTYTGMVCGNFL